MAGSEIRPGERVKDMHFGEDAFSVDLVDDRTITVPDAWYPSPLHATPEERANWRFMTGDAMADSALLDGATVVLYPRTRGNRLWLGVFSSL